MNAKFNEITEAEQLEDLFEKSYTEPIVLFKHSVTCPISGDVYREIARADADINLVVVQRARHLSNQIAEKTGVRHESPQAIVLKEGAAVYHASHYDITAEEVSQKVKTEN